MSNQHVDDYIQEPIPATETTLRTIITRSASLSPSIRVLLNHIAYLTRDGQVARPTPEELAEFFHIQYEAMSVEFGYSTQRETAIPWSDIPDDSPNKRLMIAVAASVLERFTL